MIMDKHTELKISILRNLKRMPSGYPQRDEPLRAEVGLDVRYRPTLLELEDALTELELSGHIVGTRNELTGERKWAITDSGVLALGRM